MRGHGLSIRNDGYRDNRVADYARYDLPALASFIHEQCGQPAHWIGHSLGGVVLAADWAGATWTRRGSLPWRCSVARSAPRTGCSGCPWQASSRACRCAASMRCPEAAGGRGRKTSRSAWRWRSCVGMGCSAASASRATTGGRGSPQSTYRYWRSPGPAGPVLALSQVVRAVRLVRARIPVARTRGWLRRGLRAYRDADRQGGPARGLAPGSAGCASDRRRATNPRGARR